MVFVYTYIQPGHNNDKDVPRRRDDSYAENGFPKCNHVLIVRTQYMNTNKLENDNKMPIIKCYLKIKTGLIFAFSSYFESIGFAGLSKLLFLYHFFWGGGITKGY